MDKIESLLKEWQALAPSMTPENENRLRQKFMLEFNYNSNHIEGNTLTYGQTMLLLIHGQTEGSAQMRDYEEMKAHAAALLMMELSANDNRPLTEEFIRSLHQIMLRADYTEHKIVDGREIFYTIHVGQYKTRPNSVKTKTGELFEYASPEETPILMGDLVKWYNEESQKGELSPIQLATIFHYRYIRIHPFEDGNGRIARLMVNFILKTHKCPMIVVKSDDKSNYLDALHQCDFLSGVIPSDGAHTSLKQVQPLLSYLEKCLEYSLNLYIKAAKGESVEEDDDYVKKLELLAREAALKKSSKPRLSVKALKEVNVKYVLGMHSMLTAKLKSFNPFFQDISVSLTRHYGSIDNLEGNLDPSYYVNYIKDIDQYHQVRIHVYLKSPTSLLPPKFVIELVVNVKFDSETYQVQVNDYVETYKYNSFPDVNQWTTRVCNILCTKLETEIHKNDGLLVKR